MKTVKKSVASRIRDAVRCDAFRIEPLEPRVLLSADPVFTPLLTVLAPDKNEVQSLAQAYSAVQAVSSPVVSAPVMAKLLANPTTQSATKDFPVDAVLFDMNQVSTLSGFMNSSLRVASNEILGGSGTLDVNLINTGVVSPGYSPGVQNVTSYTQDASATLKIEIGGDTAGTGTGHYDQLNVSGAATLNGGLAVSLYGGYKPKDGQVFTVMNYGSASGQFANATGLIQANDQVYFEVKQDASKLTLTAHTVAPSMKYVFDAITNEPLDQIGEWLNFGYFKDASTVNFSGSLDLGNGFNAQGDFTLGYAANQSFTPVGGTALNTDIWSLSAKNVSAFVGVSGKGLGLSGLDIDMAFVQADQAGASYGWVLGKGQADSAAITGISGLSLKGTSLALDLNYGYGKLASGAANDALLNLSTHAITVGSTTFNANGAGGEYLMASGTLAGSVGDVSLKATVGVSVIGTDFVMAGKDVAASLSAGGLSVGVSNGAFGLVSGDTGMAFEASGTLALSGGGFAGVSAQSVRVVLNRSGVSQTGEVLDFAGRFSYTFGEVAASSSLQSVSVVGLAASLGSGLSVAGNFFFEKDAATNSMRAVALNASAKVSAGTFNVGVSQASLGLVISSAGRVLEASGAISASLGSDVALSAKQVTLRLNETAADASGLKISVAGQAYTFGVDLGAGVHEVSVGGAVLTVAGFVQASGSLAVRWAGQPVALNLADGSTRQVNQLWIGGSGLSAAVGLNPGKSGFVGFNASGLEFVLGLFSDKNNSTNQWTSLSGTLGAVSLSGISGVTVATSGLALTYNTASAGQRVADFVGSHSQGITVAGKTLKLSADASKGSLLQASGQLNLDVYGFVQLSGQLAIEKKTQGVTLGDGSRASTQMLTIGGENLSAFVGMNGARSDRTGLSLTGAAFALVLASDVANPARKWTSLQASATAAKLQGVNGLTMEATSLQVMLNRAATDGSLIDYQAAPLAVSNGAAGHTLSLSMDASAGELTQASGHLSVEAYGFLQVDGDFAMSKTTDKIKLTGASALTTVDLLTICAADANAFAGMNAGKANAIGLSLGKVDFALALMQEKVDASSKTPARSWSAAHATAGSAAFVGVDGLTIAASGVEVDINRQAADASVVDFSSNKLTVSTGPASDLVLDLNGNQGQLLQASGHLKLDVFGFVQLDGDFTIQKSTLQAGVTLADGKNSGALELLSIGASNVRAFAGLNGGKANAIGLELSGVSFGLAVMTSKATPARSWTSLQATATSADFVGVKDLSIFADTLSLNINQAGQLGDAVVDYSTGKTALSVATGASGAAGKIAMNMDGADGELLRASGNLTLDVFGFFRASGGFTIEKRSASVTLSDGTATKPASTIAVDLLTIGGSGIDAFAGINGGTASAMGLSLSDVSFGLALMTEKGTAKRQFTSLQATAGAVSLVGVKDVTLSAKSLEVQINRGVAGVGTTPAVEVDYAARQMDIATGPGESHLTLDMDGSLGELTRARGQFDINLYNFVSLQGNFAFDKYDSSVKLSDKSGKSITKAVDVSMLTVGGSDINAFMGLNGGRDADGKLGSDAFGLDLTGASFGLALISDKQTPTRKWTSLQASATGLAFVGLDGLTAAGSNINVALNQAASDASVVDYGAGATNLSIATGPGGSAIALDMRGADGPSVKASAHLTLDMFGFFQVNGDFALSKSVGAVKLSNGQTIARADELTIGGHGVSVFAGIGGGTSSTLGAQISNVNFALALISDPANTAHKFTSLQATAGSASLIGVDALTLNAADLSLSLNRGFSVPATPEVTTRTNTRLQLSVPPNLAGTLTISKAAAGTQAADSAKVTFSHGQSEGQVISALTAAFESLSGVGVGNVLVTGNRYDGYVIEFIAALAGRDVVGISVSAAAASVGTSVVQTGTPQSGVNEVKRLVITTLSSGALPVTVDVSTTTQGVPGRSEGNTITFTKPGTAGSYSVFLSADGNVTVDTHAQAGQSQVQRLTLNAVGAPPAKVVASVSEESAAQTSAASEIKVIKFLTPTKTKGPYTLSLGGKSVEVTYTQNDWGSNQRYIKQALATLLKTDPKNITVGFDDKASRKGPYFYNIYFDGALANQDIGDITVTGALGKEIILNNASQQGGSGASEVQRVTLKASGVGQFTLSLVEGGKTYTTASLAFGASAAQVQLALNAALSAIGGTVSVSQASSGGDYLVTFAGSLANRSVANMTIAATAASAAPTGSFTLSLGSATSAPIAYSADAGVMAQRIQAALTALTGVGAGNVQVSVDSAHSAGSATSFAITLRGQATNVALASVNASALSGVQASTARVSAGTAATSQVQGISVGSHALSVGYSVSLSYAGQTYTSAAITAGMSQAQVQSALSAAVKTLTGAQLKVANWVANGEYSVSFGGTLAGQEIELLAITPRSEPVATPGASGTGQFVVGNTAQNITNLRNAYAAMLGTSAANISVNYDASYSAGERYVVSFVGALKFTDIADKTFRYNGAFDYQLNQHGAAPVAEVQTVKVDSSGQSGTFALSLTHGGKTYTTANIALSATAAQVQTALNAALAALTGATVNVASSASSANGEYDVSFGGSLLGVNVAELQVASIAPTPDKASGSFTIELDGQMSGAIAYSANSAVMAANIQKALQAMSNIGAGNVLVSVDAANTQGAQASYTLRFTGALAATNVSDVTAHFGKLSLGEVKPIRVVNGSAKVAAEQTVSFTTAAQDADFTLALTYGGKTYTTASLSLQASQEDVQAAVTKAFGAIAGASVSVSAWTGKALSLSFGGSLAGQAVPSVVATASVKPVTPQASVLVHGKTVVTPATPARTVVIDYAAGATDLTVDTSGDPATAITLDMKGSMGALTRVQIGRATLAISDYIYVSGGFYMEMAESVAVNVVTGLPATYPLGMDAALKTGLGKVKGLSADHSTITGLQVKTLTLSFTDAALFAGIGPYFIDANHNGLMDKGELLNTERTGITLDKIDLALVMMSSTRLSDPDAVIPKFFAFQLDWKKPLDIDMDYFKFKIDDLQVQANQGGKWKNSPKLATPFIDFKSSFGATGYEIPTSGDSIFLKYDSAFVGVSIGHALLNVGDFFQIEGSFALQKISGQKVDIVTGLPANVVGTPAASLSAELSRLKTAKYLSANNALLTNVPVDMLSIGASDVKITVGSVSDPLFTLENIDIAFTTMKATTAVDPTGKVIPRLFAVKALWANPLDLDMGFMQVKVSDLTVELNKGSKWQGTALSPYVNFTSSFGAGGLSVATGGAPIALDFNRSMFGVSVAHALVKVDDFIYLEGGFAIEKSASVAVDIATGFSNTGVEGAAALKNLVTKKLVTPGKYAQIDNLAMNVVTVGFSNVKLFAGSGPYFVDKNGDGYSDSTAVGVVVDNLNLGMAIYTASDASLNIPKLWALNATVDQAAFVGLDFLTLSAQGVTISANQGSVWAGSKVKPAVNFVSTYGLNGLLVPTGNTPVALAYSSASYGVQIAKATLQIDQFVFVQGAFSLQKGDKKIVTVDTGLSLSDVGMASTMAALASPAVGATVSKDWKTVSNLQVDAMTIGMQNVNVFVGYGTPDFASVKPVKDQSGLFGLALKDVDLALAILTPTAKNVQLPKFTALKASAGEFVVAGGDGIFNLSGNNIAVNLNWGSAWAGAAGKHASVDFKASFGAAGLAVPTGAGTINLDFTESLIEAKVSNAMLMVSEFVFISGDFAFKKSGQSQISVKQGLKITSGVKVQGIDIGAENVHAFVGINGPTRDTNSDGKINTDDLGTDAIGLRVNDLDFGLSILTAERDLLHPAIKEGTKFWGFKAHANGIGMVGFGDFIQFDLSDVSVSLNQSNDKTGMVADFTQGGTVAGRSVQTGGANPVLLDFSSELIEASVGLGTLNVAGVVSLQGGFAFQKRQIDRIGFNMAGVEVVAPADALVVAGVNVQAFAGFNGPYKTVSKDANGNLVTSSAKDGAVGFAIDNMDFILSMVTPSKASGFAVNGVNFYSLYAKADKAGLVGTDPYLTLEGTKIEIKLNGAIVKGYPIPGLYADYTEMTGKALTVKVGTAGKSMSLDYSSNLIGIKVTADLGIFDLFHIKHDFDFQFDLPKINLGNIGLPNLALPNLDFLKFKLPSLQAMKFELPSFLTDLKFDLPNFKLPTLPNVNWATLLGMPDLNVNLPRLSLSAWAKLSINLPTLKLQFPAVNFPALPDFPDLSLFGLPNLFTFPGLKLPTLPNFDWAVYLNLPGLDVNLPKLSLPAIGKLIAGWPQLKLQFPKVAFPALPDFSTLSLGVPTFDIASLRALYAHWPELKLQFPNVTFPSLPAFPDLSFGLSFLKGMPLFEVPSLSLPDLKALVAAWPKLRLDFPQFDLPALPKLPDLSIFTLPSINWSAPKIDLSALSNLVLNLPNLRAQFPDLVFPDITVPDFGLKLPSFDLPTGFLPTISLSGLKDIVPDVSLGFLKDAFNFISNIDLSIGVDLNFKPIVLGKISLPNVNLHLENFVHLHGNFELNLGQTFTGTMYTGLPAELGLVQQLLGSKADSLIKGLKSVGGLSDDFSRLSNVDFRGLTLGGSDISAFVGAGTPDFTKPLLDQSGLTGFGLDHLDVGMGIFKAQLPAFFKATDFISLTAHANSISTYGFGDLLKLTAENITLDLNSGGELFSGAMRARTDFAKSFPAINDPKDSSKNKPLGYKVQTGDPAKPVYLKFGGEDIVGLDIGMANIQVSEFLSLRGSLAFRKGERYMVDVNPGGLSGVLGALGALGATSAKVQVEAMTLGGANLTGFAGVGGPYRYGVDLHGPDGKTGAPDGYLDTINSGAVGLVVDHVDFALAMMTPTVFKAIPGLPNAPTFISAKAKVGDAFLTGIDKNLLDVQAHDVEVNINTFVIPGGPIPNAVLQLVGPPSINYQTSFSKTKGLAVPAGGSNSVLLDFAEEIIQAKVGYAQINLAGFVQLSASMAFTKKGSETVTLSNGEVTQVSTLAIGIADAYGFVGVGSYWRDTSGNGRIGAEDQPDTSAVGLAIENLNVGLIVARELVLAPAGLKIGLYLAAQADIQSVKLVGVPDVTLQATGLRLDLNTGVRTVISSGFTQDAATGAFSFDVKKSGMSVSLTTIDFSRSNWKDMSLAVNKDADTANDIVNPGYGIPTGNPSHPIVLDYKDQLIRIHGQAKLDLMGLVKMDGVLDFEFNASNGLTVFADVKATIGQGDFSFSSHATGLLVVGKRNDIGGVALRLELEAGLNMGSVASLDAKLELSLNTFGENIVYDVPKEFQAALVASHFPDWKYTIAATPTSKPDWKGAYVQLLGNGSLSLLDGALKLDGDFGIVISASTGIEVTVAATLQLPLLRPLAVVGTLGLIGAGVYGSLEVGGTGPHAVLIGSSAFSLAGRFLLQINTTNTTQTVRAINTSDQGGAIVQVGLKPQSLHIAGNVSIDVLGGALHLGGSMDMTIDKTGITAEAELKLELGPLGSIDVKGGIAFVLEGDTPVFALRLETQIKLGTSLIGFSAGAVLEINTGSQAHVGVLGGQVFKLALTDGKIHISAFDIDFSGAMTLTDDNVFRLDFSGNLNFFGALKIDVGGYIQSDGKFSITGHAGLDIDLVVLKLAADVSVTISDYGIKASASGELTAVGFSLAGFEAEIELTRINAKVSASVTILVTVSGSFTWSLADPPVIDYQIGDTLYLNMGNKSGRYGDNAYNEIVNEDYKITKESDGSIMVRSLDEKSRHTGVKRIVANGGSGNDSIEIGAGVDALIEFDGGAGNDKVVMNGGAAGSKIYGGDGNDTFEGGDISGMSWYGGAGNDKYTGGAGSAQIEMGEGSNTISTGNGNNTVRIDGGSTALSLGSGNNDILVSTAGAVINVKGGQSGYDHLTFDPVASRGAILLGNHQLNLNDTVVVFEDGLDRISITDQNTVRSTVVTTVATSTPATNAQDWGSTDFELKSAGIIDVQDANFKMADGHLTLIAPKGIDGILNTEIDGLTVVNNGRGALGAIVVREANSLNITSDDKTNGGLYAINGKVAVQLNARDSLLRLESGAIVSNVEGITLVADKVDLLSGENKVQSSGTAVMIAPISPKSPILVDNLAAGTVGSETYRLSTDLLDYLKNESHEIQIGSHISSSVIFIGRAGLVTPIALSDTLRLLNPILGGDMFINAPLVLTNDSSLIIEGSGQSGTASLDKAYVLGTPGGQPQASGSSFGLGNYDYSVNTLLL